MGYIPVVMEQLNYFWDIYKRNFIDSYPSLNVLGGKNCFDSDAYWLLQKEKFLIVQLKGQPVSEFQKPNFDFTNNWDLSRNTDLENQRAVFSEVAIQLDDGLAQVTKGKEFPLQLIDLANYDRLYSHLGTRAVIGKYADYLAIDNWFRQNNYGSIFPTDTLIRTASIVGKENVVFGKAGQTLTNIPIDISKAGGVAIYPILIPINGQRGDRMF